MTPDLFWIPGPWRGRLAVITRPRGGDWLEDEVKGWRLASINVVVSLLESEEAEQLGLRLETKIAADNDVRVISFPVPDRGLPTSKEDFLGLMQQVSKELELGLTVAVHCRQGIGRSGLTAIGLLVNSGINVEEAIESVSKARRITVPETAEQLLWIRGLAGSRVALAR